MHTIYILSLLCVLTLLARAAPLPECSGKTAAFMENPEFIRTVKKTSVLVNKVLQEISEVRKSCVSSEAFDPDSTENLQYLTSTLGIPSSPTITALSATFTMEMCLDRIYTGLQQYQDLLTAVRDRISSPDKVADLLHDIGDVLAQVVKMRELAQLGAGEQYGGSGLSARLTDDYKVQAAAHITLHGLRSFSQDVFRSLRNIALAKPAARC